MALKSYIVNGKEEDLSEIRSIFYDLIDGSFINSGAFREDMCYVECSSLQSEAFYFPRNRILRIKTDETGFLEEIIKTEAKKRNLKLKFREID